jgi:hypothetical protein
MGNAFAIVNPRLAANRSVGTFRFDLNIYPIDFDHDYYCKLPSPGRERGARIRVSVLYDTPRG